MNIFDTHWCHTDNQGTKPQSQKPPLMPALSAELPALRVNSNLSQGVASELKPGPAVIVRATLPRLFPGILLKPGN